MAAPRPLPVTPPGLLDDEDPGKWEKLKQVLWESNLNAPVRGVYNLMNTPYDVLMGGPSPEFDRAVADSFDAAGGISVGSAVAPKPSNALNMGIRAYHGSPHSFDKFSMDKIGTGEGAQAYGHGLYFAENEGVAKGYRDTLSKSMIDGAKKRLDAAGGDIDKAIADVQAKIDNYRANGAPQYADAIEEDLRGLQAFKRTGDFTPGSMYEVEINADPNAFLDWDKPLSADAPQAIKDAFNKVANSDPVLKEKFHQAFRDQQPGNIYYSILNDHARTGNLVKNQTFATKKLREAGIPGIKYLDAGSRGAGDGTRNYVVFDDSLIDIIKKYGIAGLLGGSGLYGMSGDEAQAGAY